MSDDIEIAGSLSPWEQSWIDQLPDEIPSSTAISPRFLDLIEPQAQIVDLGCGTCRWLQSATQVSGTVIGIDINIAELKIARRGQHRFFGVNANAQRMPFKDSTFDVAVELALLGGIERSLRVSILQEAARVVRPGGLLYVTEFALATGDEYVDSNGSAWRNVYIRDLPLTREYGSFVVRRANGTRQFIAHHFSADELETLVYSAGFILIDIENSHVRSDISSEMRMCWNVWARRK